MATEKCGGCYSGEVVNFDKYEDEFDRMYDGGQFSAYEVFLHIRGKYNDGAVKCSRCNGTGVIEKEAKEK
ncbi:hypothetical protein [Bacillus wiedmannii]|nr:hypothetical protein [Bacillus wiedmannii]PHB58154.1 hypothetical protein COE87_28655 [Bacillus wiedmannii]